jgi:hypothetical protein
MDDEIDARIRQQDPARDNELDRWRRQMLEASDRREAAKSGLALSELQTYCDRAIAQARAQIEQTIESAFDDYDESVGEAIAHFRDQMNGAIGTAVAKYLEADVPGLQADVSALRGDVDQLRGIVDNLSSELAALRAHPGAPHGAHNSGARPSPPALVHPRSRAGCGKEPGDETRCANSRSPASPANSASRPRQ